MRNPAKGIIVLTPPEGEWNCGIYDISGRLVWSDKLSGEVNVDVSSWNSGCFMVILSDDEVELKQTTRKHPEFHEDTSTVASPLSLPDHTSLPEMS